MAHRSFLFLQGPLSPLYTRIANRLERRGHAVCRVNFCVGDGLHWRRRGAVAFRGRVCAWPQFLTRLLEAQGVTDIIMHSERRLYHRIAAAIARRRGVRVIITELGYLRPDWMTLELNGTGAGSHFPADAADIRRIAAITREVDFTPVYQASFARVAVPDVIYNLANTLLWFIYPRYRRHTIYYPPLEYAAWLWRLLSAGKRRRAAFAALAEMRAHRYFLFALQLEGDFQIRHRSPYRGLAPAIDAVLASFAAHAPAASRLVIKTHPLDNGLDGWRRLLPIAINRYGLSGRVMLADGGALAPWLAAAQGMVTVNSSAGIEALIKGCPVKTLAPAIYDVAGLTHQGDLASFWREPQVPDSGLLHDFLKALANTVQVRGTIYAADGLEAVVNGMTERILDGSLNAPGAYADPAPRLAALRRQLRARRLKAELAAKP